MELELKLKYKASDIASISLTITLTLAITKKELAKLVVTSILNSSFIKLLLIEKEVSSFLLPTFLFFFNH